jgi:hypothetical protein
MDGCHHIGEEWKKAVTSSEWDKKIRSIFADLEFSFVGH